MDKKEQNTKMVKESTPNTGHRKPNETGSISVEAHVKIFDPKTKEVYVEKRA